MASALLALGLECSQQRPVTAGCQGVPVFSEPSSTAAPHGAPTPRAPCRHSQDDGPCVRRDRAGRSDSQGGGHPGLRGEVGLGAKGTALITPCDCRTEEPPRVGTGTRSDGPGLTCRHCVKPGGAAGDLPVGESAGLLAALSCCPQAVPTGRPHP